MPQEFRHCTMCDGVINEIRDMGRLRWFHCEKCGAWSLGMLAPADSPPSETPERGPYKTYEASCPGPAF